MSTKKLSIFLLAFLIIPQITFAAWWNPTTWKIFHNRAAKTEAVQLKTEVSGTTSAPIATTTKEVETKKTSSTSFQRKESVEKKINNSYKKELPEVNSKAPSSSEILQKYVDLKAIIVSEKNSIDRDSILPVDLQYIKHLNQLLMKIDADIGYLDQSKNWAFLPPNIPAIYFEKFNKINEDYLMQKRSYSVDRGEALVAQSRQKEEDAKQKYLEISELCTKSRLAYKAATDRKFNLKEEYNKNFREIESKGLNNQLRSSRVSALDRKYKLDVAPIELDIERAVRDTQVYCD
jgi:hypothetical protein